MPDALPATLLRWWLRLPGPVLNAFCGDEPAELGGRRLDPRFRFLAHAARGRPGLETLPLGEARRAVGRGAALGASPPEPGVSWETVEAPGAAGPRPARLYRPRRRDPRAPVMLWLHGGGGVLGDLETSHGFCTVLSAALQAPVLSLDYRLAPEHRFPAGLDDAQAAFGWVREEAGRLGGPAGAVAVGGDSAGGWMAALLCQRLRAAGEPQPALQLLVYPATDMASQTQSLEIYADSFLLPRQVLAWCRDLVFAPGTDLADPAVSPLHAPALEGLAPAVVVTAGFDPLVDQGEAYAHRLVTAADAALYRCYDALPHGFLNFTGLVPAAEVAAREIAGLARQGCEGLLPVSAHARAAHAGDAAQPAPTASATVRKPSAWRRWRNSRASRGTSPGPA